MTQQGLDEYSSVEEQAESTTESDSLFIPSNCIGFDIAADFAHFRKVGNNSAKPTYRIPPRTTVAGLLAGILGVPRDSYYDMFKPSSSAVAVVPKKIPHTYTMGITTVNTKADDAIQYRPSERHWSKAAEVLTPESYIEYDRQRDTYEMLVDPVYRIYVGLEDDDIYEELYSRLEESRYHYSPSLGLSECIAEINGVEMHEVSVVEADTADSASYNDSGVLPTPRVKIRRERAPLYMTADEESGRRTTAFGNITYTADEDGLPISDVPAYRTGPHTVLFH